MNKFLVLTLSVLMTCVGCSTNAIIEYRLKNPSQTDRSEVVSLDLAGEEFGSKPLVVLDKDGKEIPVEAIDMDADGKPESLLVEVALGPSQEMVVRVKPGDQPIQPQKKTQAEMSIKQGGVWNERKYEGGDFVNVNRLKVPVEHTDHSNYVRYEGPGLESDKAAYRYYLDWRNGVDFFGKKTSGLVLQGVGLDGFDSYHEPADWGMDVLKVGNTLGLGSIGLYENGGLIRFQEVDSTICTVSSNGLLKSGITTTYFGWKADSNKTTLTSTMSVLAGSALTTHDVQMVDALPGFCTGLVVNEGESFIDKISGDYWILITYGNFSLAGDGLGLAVIVRNEDVDQVLEDVGSHVVLFKPIGQLTYYFLAAWQQDYSKVSSVTEFEALVDQEAQRLTQPILVEKLGS